MTSPVIAAAAPELVAIIKAAQTLVTNLGSDPLKLPLTAGPALQVFLGTVGLQVAPAINAEWAAVQSEINGKLNDLVTKLQAVKAS